MYIMIQMIKALQVLLFLRIQQSFQKKIFNYFQTFIFIFQKNKILNLIVLIF